MKVLMRHAAESFSIRALVCVVKRPWVMGITGGRVSTRRLAIIIKGGNMKIRQVVGTAAASLGLVMGLAGGVVGAQSAAIETTGPDSYNKIKQVWERNVRVRNDNDVRISNDNHQYARSGDAKVIHNTTGGDARTGDAMNENAFELNAEIHNTGTATNGAGGAGGGNWDARIQETGPDSYNKVVMKNTSSTYVSNDNDVCINNHNSQTAKTGDAMVVHNTTGGDAVSGDAVNTNNTSVSLTISN